MNPEPEIRRLLDLMPASGRMLTKIVHKPQQSQVIQTPFPLPWNRNTRPIYINFDLWRELSKPQRDLLLLRAVSWLIEIKWFKPDLYQGIVLAGLLGGTFEIVQADAIGVVVAGGLSAIAGGQVWRNTRSVQTQLDSDEAAIKVAQRRGYEAVEAAEHLLAAIEEVAQMEGRSSLNFTELIRSQNLKAIANHSPVGVPEKIKQE
ncbi:MAG: hypothetical protein BRC40_11025 [Cyanobacteria bacterium QH_8_48_120]|jgi:hypothetical protein|nr:MAG: hypothetical protein BRC34_11965 [Cyanobacteria bacterium QH_1_48_107]PSO60182.1 MAG: hypothetical protein BRC35_02210 [Cyanobacteria bacterium QH_10_48_56]PSO63382.1 MAG: hypothetical protein BRC38_13750 [Cyanobacteria bacterium QH_6_48_35]PSO68159.1 MAG: hypothetical protein BRC39_00190 [Cyanobacteria bacterium QH_7_48_89]PSO71888.1 MAG: hypothetical protein BRC40_11025 [Cyanobacteria bacterium QH_8_48_120]PSO72275.1 MAG: hypothetical protein BRC37_12095 [Cyanobacteria bacterium QH_3